MKVFIAVFTILILILGLRFFFFFQNQSRYTSGQELVFESRLTEEPKVSGFSQRFGLRTPDNQVVYLSTSAFPSLHYGDTLLVKGKASIKQTENGHEIFTMSFPQIKRLDRHGNLFIEASTFIRQRSTLLFNQTLPPISSSLLLGIVFGAKEDFPQEFLQSLRTTGVMHVIAASGMNVSFFTGAVMFSLGTFLKRRVALTMSVFAVIFYSFLVGFEPSILRASIMALIAFAASFLGRQNLAIVALFITGIVMLLFDPSFIFDVGFQLSFMATLGILLIGREIGKISWLKKLGSLKDDLTTTVSAQIATVPILLGTFGSIGTLSVVVNMLVLWTVPILMLLGSLAVIVGLVVPPLGKMLLVLSLPFLLFFEKVVSFFGAIGWNLQLEAFPWELGVGYYLVLISVIFLLQKRRNEG